MSSYIGIGFISKWTTKNIFISHILKAFDNEISLLGFANLIDILNQCFDNYEKEFRFDIKIDEFDFTNIILQIEKIENDCICLQLCIAEDELIGDRNIDIVENKIISFIMKKAQYFDFIFCDNNAYLENNFNEICKEPLFSILVMNKDGKIDIKYANWKIDGLSERQNI